LELRSFWVPGVDEKSSSNSPTIDKKPTTEVQCPESDHIIRLKQLIKLNLTVSKKDSKEEESGKKTAQSSYECPVCSRGLSGAIKATVIKKCGHVICCPCLEKIKKDAQCYVCSKKFKEKHLIKLQSGGTGYAGSTGDKLTAKVVTPTAWL